MISIFLASHGHLASGMLSSMKILVGEGTENKLSVFDAFVDDGDLAEELDSFLSCQGDGNQVIMLSDLYGGSVNQVMSLRLKRPNTYLIAGVNLALLLEIALHQGEYTKEELKAAIEESRKYLKLVELDQVSLHDEAFF